MVVAPPSLAPMPNRPARPAICFASGGASARRCEPSYFFNVVNTTRLMDRFSPIPMASLAMSTSYPEVGSVVKQLSLPGARLRRQRPVNHARAATGLRLDVLLQAVHGFPRKRNQAIARFHVLDAPQRLAEHPQRLQSLVPVHD